MYSKRKSDKNVESLVSENRNQGILKCQKPQQIQIIENYQLKSSVEKQAKLPE